MGPALERKLPQQDLPLWWRHCFPEQAHRPGWGWLGIGVRSGLRPANAGFVRGRLQDPHDSRGTRRLAGGGLELAEDRTIHPNVGQGIVRQRVGLSGPEPPSATTAIFSVIYGVLISPHHAICFTSAHRGPGGNPSSNYYSVSRVRALLSVLKHIRV